MTKIRTQNLGYPRIGAQRELKRQLERYWRGEVDWPALANEGARLRRSHWERQRAAGIDRIPSNDFSYYDHVLDLSVLLGNVPARFQWTGDEIPPELYFEMARGKAPAASPSGCRGDAAACEMTKWFDTNYHYLVPEFDRNTRFRLSGTKPFDEYLEAKALGLDTVPVLVGPLTYLVLGKDRDADEAFDRYTLLDGLLETYVDILRHLSSIGATRVRLDEPALALDLDEAFAERYARAYARFASEIPDLAIEVAVYFGELRGNLPILLSLPVAGIHVDAVRARAELPALVDGLAASDKELSLGLIDGRNVWKTDLKSALSLAKDARERLGSERLLLAPSCSLLHVPVSLKPEKELDPELTRWLAFADEKLEELSDLAEALAGTDQGKAALLANEAALLSRRCSARVNNPAVQARLASLREEDFVRHSPFPERRRQQRERLALPLLPTTTIGSFPQTPAIREARAKWRRGVWSDAQYETFLRLTTADCIRRQEQIGLDVLVHGEFERNDMVEYFGEQLEGFAFTRQGWVQSYGSRCVKPPILFGDVSRPQPMTVSWARFAQAQSKRPLKGMLTGPVTLLQWSFVRDDQPRRDTALQIALAIRDEVRDLEAAGLPIIQIDEAAIREGLPLRRADWGEYLDWAVRAFRLASSGVQDATQIHTHMCYSEFQDMLEAIVALDADVITIENARSGWELLEKLERFAYPNEIGPGVYDIHSPRVPGEEEILGALQRTLEVIPPERLWVNPDCGLKTRGWPEVEAALSQLVRATRRLRSQLEQPTAH